MKRPDNHEIIAVGGEEICLTCGSEPHDEEDCPLLTAMDDDDDPRHYNGDCKVCGRFGCCDHAPCLHCGKCLL